MLRNSVLTRSVLLKAQILADELAAASFRWLRRGSDERVVHEVERLENGAVLLARLVVAIAAQESYRAS